MFRSLVLRESKRARVPFSWHAPLRLSRLSMLEHMRTYRSFVAYASGCEKIKLVSRSPICDHSLSLSLLLFSNTSQTIATTKNICTLSRFSTKRFIITSYVLLSSYQIFVAISKYHQMIGNSIYLSLIDRYDDAITNTMVCKYLL